MTKCFPKALALGLALLAAPAHARDIYECTFPIVANNMGYLPDLVIVSPSEDGMTASVVDAILNSETGGPIEVKIAEENDRKLSVSWTIMLQSTVNDYVNMYYRISVQKGNLRASLIGKPQGYSNDFTAQGTCRRTKT